MELLHKIISIKKQQRGKKKKEDPKASKLCKNETQIEKERKATVQKLKMGTSHSIQYGFMSNDFDILYSRRI